MKFAHLTTDEVYQDLARTAGNLQGVEVETMEPRDLPLRVPCTGVIVSWDDLDGSRQKLLDQLLTVMPRQAIALHTYNRDEQDHLRSQGMAVFPQLNAALFRALVAAVRPQAA